MIYTFQKRRELNSQFIGRFNGIPHHEGRDGVPYLLIKELPKGATRAVSVSELEIPRTGRPWDKIIPVFIHTMIINEDDGQMVDVYIVNYVNCSEPSLRIVSEYISEGRVYFVPGVEFHKGQKYNIN